MMIRRLKPNGTKTYAPGSRTSASKRLLLEPLEDRQLLTTCHVTRLGDSGGGFGFRGDLRYCINKVNDLPGPDVIDFKVTGTINLNSALPELASDIDIQGPGADQLAVRRNTASEYRILYIMSDARVRVSGLSLTKGSHPEGSGIYNAGNLRIEACTIALNGGHFFNTPIHGGGIYNLGTLWLDNSTVSDNAAATETFGTDDAFGGGIYNAGKLTVRNSTVSGNGADSFDGESRGAGIANAGTLTVRFSTIAANGFGFVGKGGGIWNTGQLDMRNTVLAANGSFIDDGPDLWGTLTASGYNVIGDSSGGSGYSGSDLLDVDPLLAPLADNGGSTFTMALLPGSPAIDAGDNTDAPEWDQRGPGFPRIVNGTIDIGAFEVQATGLPSIIDSLAVYITAAFGIHKAHWRD